MYKFGICALLLNFLLASPLHAEMPSGFNVANWGDSINEIIAVMGPPRVVSEDGTLIYDNQVVGGMKATIIFSFEEGCSNLKRDADNCRFAEGTYRFTNCSDEEFENVEMSLSEKYSGKHRLEEVPKDANGYRRYETFRDISKARIWHILLSNQDGSCYSHSLYYQGPYHFDLRRKKALKSDRVF